MTKTWLIVGATGLIGGRCAKKLVEDGHRVIGLTRTPRNRFDRLSPDIHWINRLEDCPETPEIVLNLFGAPIADKRWSVQRKHLLRTSRIDPTLALSIWVDALEQKPELVISGSAVGYYGIGAAACTEDALAGHGFAADLCADWEGAMSAECRTVHLRIGVVIAKGGILAKLLPLFRWGLGGIIGNGHQMMSWISLTDLVSMIRFIADHPHISDPINATAPNPVSNREFTRALANALHRPALLPMPGWVMRLAFGQMADELLLAGQVVLPTKITNRGFEYQHSNIAEAIQAALDDQP